MTPQIIFARVKPKVIRLTERYGYQDYISKNSNLNSQGKPRGRLEIIIPYDGQKYFNRRAIKDIEHQIPDIWRQKQEVEARIGYIGLTNHDQTNLDTQLDLNSCHNVLPLNIPVQGQELQGGNSLRNNRHTYQITYDYIPDWPVIMPLRVNVEIYDEDAFEQTFDEEMIRDLYRKLESLSEEMVNKVAKQVAQQVGFRRYLIFEFLLELSLPTLTILSDNDNKQKEEEKQKDEDDEEHEEHEGDEESQDKEKNSTNDNKNALPILTHMEIEWPVATSHHVVSLEEIREKGKPVEKPVTYDPERGVIQWADIRFKKKEEKEKGTNLDIYQTRMRLFIDQPGELYQQEVLAGKVEVKIPNLLSGLQVDYFAANGPKRKPDIEGRTIIASDLTLNLEECFARKRFSPYQMLQFEGVIVNEMRIANIKILLENQGFNSDYQQLPTDRSDLQHYVVVGTQRKELEQLRILMFVEGTRSQTTRKKEILGGQTFTTKLTTGHTIIYMRGELRGNKSDLIGMMNEIQKKLKEQFRHVSTID